MSVMDVKDKLSSENICRFCIKHKCHELMKCHVFVITKLWMKTQLHF